MAKFAPMSIQSNLAAVKSQLPATVTLVAVSKTKPNEDVMQAYEAGQRVFGENKVQELVGKYEALPKDIQWHMIGHLQRNKVKYIAPFVHLVHGVDSFKLLKELNKEGVKNDRVINCLLQFHIADEETKFGLDMQEATEMLNSQEYAALTHVNIMGVMGMATFTEDEAKVAKEFRNLKAIFDKLKADYFSQKPDFKEISMGMSGDYLLAVQEGSTMVRVGSSIFGSRN